jgi:ATP-dependent DNA helicase RecQ
MNDGTRHRAQELLRDALGHVAEFRPGQLEAILKLVDEGERTLVVQRTGWGKSVVYFIATRLLRDRGAGPTILISPLLSLMRDQLKAAGGLGLNAVNIDSTNPEAWDDIEQALTNDQIDLLMISPERLNNVQFRTRTIASIERGIGLFVVDEAHCISDWGHDFRPDYQRIKRLVDQLPEGVPVLATTATANDRVQADVAGQLGPRLDVIAGPLSRDSLYLQVVSLAHQAERLAWLAEYLDKAEGSGIVYTLTIRDAELVSDWLASRGIQAPAYHSKLEDEERRRLEDALHGNQLKALVATVALGMGFDKPDLSFVVHYQRPGSVVAYYQQVGRAGRALDRAEIVLLSGQEDDAIGDYFINNAFPPEDELAAVLAAVEDVDEVTVNQLMEGLNLSKGSIERALKFLDIEGVVVKDGPKWSRTPNAWEPQLERGERVTDVRRREQQRMRDYAKTEDCLMAFLASELDDHDADACGRCANCAGPFAPMDVDGSVVRDAVHFLRHAHRPIEPRKRWPIGLKERTNIPAELQLDEGRALCLYGDAGWGELVKQGKFVDNDFDDELVDATVEMIAEWRPDPAPTWVTAVPSRRNPGLVAHFAKRLADALGLPYREALVKVKDTEQQKRMENGYQQARNALEAFEAVEDEVDAGPVLLVDDMVDSRWSMTVCGIALREAGAGRVYPVALAETTRGSDLP